MLNFYVPYVYDHFQANRETYETNTRLRLMPGVADRWGCYHVSARWQHCIPGHFVMKSIENILIYTHILICIGKTTSPFQRERYSL